MQLSVRWSASGGEIKAFLSTKMHKSYLTKIASKPPVHNSRSESNLLQNSFSVDVTPLFGITSVAKFRILQFQETNYAPLILT